MAKRFFILILLQALLCASYNLSHMHASTSTAKWALASNGTEDDIELEESTKGPKIKSVLPSIKASLGSDYIRISIVNGNLTNVEVAIVDSNGLVIHSAALTQAETFISTDGWPNGEYKIMLSTDNGNREWSGFFSID